ncbi:hypothetical protein KR222_009367 [Zaprionus bogoriensis]|nr:hypothetical protein KR222_009367 [Zaprionus bogoriensis]
MFFFLDKLLLLLLCGICNAEFYSSIQEMSKVYGYEQRMLQHMQKFIDDNQSKLDFLRARLDEYERERNEALHWGVAYFESPLNQYLLSKRLTFDWQRTVNLMAAATGEKPLVRLQQLRQKKFMPDARELEGAIDGLLRLQSIYRLPSKHIAAGILDGVSYGTQLNAEHCLDIGHQALRDGHTHLAHAWLEQAANRLTNADRGKLQPQIVQLRGHIIERLTVNSTEQDLDSQPGQKPNEIEEHPVRSITQHIKPINLFMRNFSQPLPEVFSNLSEFDAYRFTCSGHIRPTAAEQRHLRCGYLTETHPFLLLAPLKVEELSHDPLLVLYHEVIYQSEIDVIAELTKNKITRATVTGQNSSVRSNSRTSQFTFLPKTRHKVLQTIDRRVEDMTNLNMSESWLELCHIKMRINTILTAEYAEDHQFSNYGIGGHYAQHMDWFYPNAFETNQVNSPEMGNRIATVLFYLTDVAQGGGTAFPVLKQLLKPQKYAVAFWYNLHASGVGDVRTMHGACPIISGSKWVLNRWIREYTQSDRRPCHLWNDWMVSLRQLLEMSKGQM